MTFEELLAPSSPAAQEVARRLLAHARELVPDAVETCEGGDYGVGTSPGYKGLVFVITPQRDAVRLGIAGGASLDDPAGLLEGTGKVHRFVRVREAEAADAPELLDLMRRAAGARR